MPSKKKNHGHRSSRLTNSPRIHGRSMCARWRVKLSENGDLGEPNRIRLSEAHRPVDEEKKNLNANVDFTMPVYLSLGIPTDLFTPIFCTLPLFRIGAHTSRKIGRQSAFLTPAQRVHRSGRLVRKYFPSITGSKFLWRRGLGAINDKVSCEGPPISGSTCRMN